MNEYKVTWEIDLSADNPFEAAKEARDIQRSSDSIATIYRVQGSATEPPTTVVAPATKFYYENDVITCAAYFYEYLEVIAWPDGLRDYHGGCIGVTTEYSSIPVLLARLCYAGSKTLGLEFPGVYEYEVCEEVGAYGRDCVTRTGKAPTLSELEQFSVSRAFRFFLQGTADHATLAKTLDAALEEHRKK